MEVIFVGGFSEHVNDGSKLWEHADEVESMGHTVVRLAWTDNIFEQLRKKPIGKRLLVVYSYGCAATFHALSQLPTDEILVDFIVIIAGVNRVPMFHQQWQDCWKIPSSVDSAIAINTIYRACILGQLQVVPECAPIRNTSEKRINRNVWWDNVNHSNVVGLCFTRDTIIDAVKQLQSEEDALCHVVSSLPSLSS